MRKLAFGMNLSVDGYIAAPGDDLGWSVPSDELFQWWSDRVGATGLALYGRKLWETMSSHWPAAGQQPGATPAQIEFARRCQLVGDELRAGWHGLWSMSTTRPTRRGRGSYGLDVGRHGHCRPA